MLCTGVCLFLFPKSSYFMRVSTITLSNYRMIQHPAGTGSGSCIFVPRDCDEGFVVAAVVLLAVAGAAPFVEVGVDGGAFFGSSAGGDGDATFSDCNGFSSSFVAFSFSSGATLVAFSSASSCVSGTSTVSSTTAGNSCSSFASEGSSLLAAAESSTDSTASSSTGGGSSVTTPSSFCDSFTDSCSSTPPSSVLVGTAGAGIVSADVSSFSMGISFSSVVSGSSFISSLLFSSVAVSSSTTSSSFGVST
mmetsp:Transcript_7635/g.10875  ORF Transcript_7635/g.10875 Transcript_7635/m.10875 type:complete len:249 (+) Transcript_7635:193-939(+)